MIRTCPTCHYRGDCSLPRRDGDCAGYLASEAMRETHSRYVFVDVAEIEKLRSVFNLARQLIEIGSRKKIVLSDYSAVLRKLEEAVNGD